MSDDTTVEGEGEEAAEVETPPPGYIPGAEEAGVTPEGEEEADAEEDA